MKAFCQSIVEHTRPLYGRPAWSVRYLEHVKATLSGDLSSSTFVSPPREDVKRAADDAMNEIKGDLRNRLHLLQRKGIGKAHGKFVQSGGLE
jgi:hypothetical protein